MDYVLGKLEGLLIAREMVSRRVTSGAARESDHVSLMLASLLAELDVTIEALPKETS